MLRSDPDIGVADLPMTISTGMPMSFALRKWHEANEEVEPGSCYLDFEGNRIEGTDSINALEGFDSGDVIEVHLGNAQATQATEAVKVGGALSAGAASAQNRPNAGTKLDSD